MPMTWSTEAVFFHILRPNDSAPQVEHSVEMHFPIKAHLGEFDWVVDNVRDELVYRVGVERGLSHIQLIQDHPKAPQIDGMIVCLFLNQLWRHVQRRAFDRGEYHRVLRHKPSEPEVAELHLGALYPKSYTWHQ